MKYILSQEEYDTLRSRKEDAKAEDVERLQKFCTMVADTLPVLFWSNTEPKIWGCILSKKNEWYCDQCPSQDVCPNEYKEWSK